jgi:hypothetical protein
VFFVLSLLPLCAISSNSLSARFGADEIGHLLDIAFNEEIDSLIANSCSVSKVYNSRNFKNHVRIDNLSYGAVIIESIISHNPFDLSVIENFYNRYPNPCLLDYKTLLAKYTRGNSTFDFLEIVGNHGKHFEVIKRSNDSINPVLESSVFSGLYESMLNFLIFFNSFHLC